MKRITVLLFTILFAGSAWAGSVSESRGTASSDAGALAIIDASDNSRVVGGDMPDGSKRVPDVNVIAPGTANNCALGVGAGFGVSGIGAAVSASYESEPCNRRADSQHAAGLGQRAVAREISCGGFIHYKANVRLFNAGRIAPEDACLPNEEFDAKIADEKQRHAEARTARLSGNSQSAVYIMGGKDPAFGWQHTYE